MLFFRSLRAKITLGYYLVGGLFIGLASFAYAELQAIEAVIATTKAVSDFFDAAREVRNQEKNLLLYRRPADFTEAESRFSHALALIDLHRSRFADLVSVSRVDLLRDGLVRYRQSLTDYWSRLRRTGAYPAELEQPLHNARVLVQEESERLARAGDETLAWTLDRHRWNLLASIVAVTVLLMIAGQLLSRRVVRPLREMEQEMEAVAQGQRKTLELRATDKEIASLTSAFNHVLAELETRQNEAVRVEKLATLGTMLSGVAHELNNPLSNISTSTQIMLEEFGQADPAYQQQLLAQVDQEIDRARAIVRSLLDFAHDRAARREDVALAAVVEDTLRLIRGQIPDSVAVKVDVPADLRITADRQRIQQVLLNLVKNAAEASAAGGEVAIRARRFPPSTESALPHRFRGRCEVRAGVDIEVADRGAGIPEEVLARIFDPFFTTKDVGKGTGLGLFVVHEIVGEHGGCIEAESRPGAGTVFHLRLPGGDPAINGATAT